MGEDTRKKGGAVCPLEITSQGESTADFRRGRHTQLINAGVTASAVFGATASKTRGVARLGGKKREKKQTQRMRVRERASTSEREKKKTQ